MSLIKLAFAGDYNGVLALLEENPEKSNECDELGHSALFCAVIGKHLQVCELLVARGFDVNEQSSEFGFTLLHKACLGGSFEICKLLVESGADVSAKDPKDSDAIYNAITGDGDVAMCQYLIRKGARSDGAFHLACFNGKIDVARWLLEEKAKGVRAFVYR
jgi:ankyrin repeat protein